MTDSQSELQIEATDVTRAFEPTDDGRSTQVLAGVSLGIVTGESVAIVGPSGCGKSTLLNIIGGLMLPTSGTIRVDGNDLASLGESALAEFRNRSLGFVFQAHHLLPHCSAIENVLIPTIVHPDEALRRAAPDRARQLLERVGLADRMTHRPGQLSGGECQRVAVARALINHPKILLADEPTGSLDDDAADRLGDLLIDLNSTEGVTLLTVTHSLKLAARMRRGLQLNHGRVEPWTPDE